MKIHTVEQNTAKWNDLHIGIPTAGGLGNLLTPKFEVRKGETPKTYVYTKIAEKFRNQSLMYLGPTSFSVEQGSIVEADARPFYKLLTGRVVEKVGFISTEDGKFGCSPDGLVMWPELIGHKGDVIAKAPMLEDALAKGWKPLGEWEYGLEIKCPAAHTHVKYLCDGKVPDEYLAQVHGGMYVTGFKKWVFMSYRINFPTLIIEVERDEAIQQKIGEALTGFWAKFNEEWAKLQAYVEKDTQ